MARPRNGDFVVPRKLPAARLGSGEPAETVLPEQRTELALHRMARSTLERIAALLRTSDAPEALEEAARLETVAAGMRPRKDGRRFPRCQLRVTGAGWEQLMTRHDCAQLLGITTDSLSVMISRGSGEAQFQRLGDNGEPELIRVFRCNLTKSPKSLS